ESLSVTKQAQPLLVESVLAEQVNMVFASGLVSNGRCKAVVTAIGMQTEIGKIATLMNQTKQRKTPLQISLDDFSKKLSIAIIIICILVFGLNWINSGNVLDSLMFAVALAVAAIPEALSSIVTIVLALGTKKMADQNAIIKNLNAVESLGSVSVICSDKTGTLTQNIMSVSHCFINQDSKEADDFILDNDMHRLMMTASVLCNDAQIEGAKRLGDPTEMAFLDFAKQRIPDYHNLRTTYERTSELPFDSERKLMSTQNKIDGSAIMFVKGAPDELIKACDRIMIQDEILAMTQDHIDTIFEANRSYAILGERVLGFAFKQVDDVALELADEQSLIFIGMISMVDPPREESKLAITTCKQAGIKPIMITGDHKTTAVAIARSIGLFEDGDEVVDGLELAAMDDDTLYKKLANISVYARVAPEHKIRIVSAWQKRGQIVGMTGDGVNDAPALKRADIGIAMGITGTEVSKDAASMVLTDDNFATIINAIITGRNVYANIRNAIKYLLSGNLSGILCVLFATLTALPNPFLPVHLLFINLVTDSLPAIAIGVERSSANVLHEKPRASNAPMLSRGVIMEIAFEGFLIAAATLFMYFLGLQENGGVATTLAFSTLCLARLYHGFNCRNRASIFRIGLFSNRYSIYAFVLGFVFLNAILLFPFLHGAFGVTDITINQLFLVYGVALLPTIVIQLVKVVQER
ncbi:MAG: cation-translocating P-type ATPase, partial [Erysipelotrichaceae bacterium]